MRIRRWWQFGNWHLRFTSYRNDAIAWFYFSRRHRPFDLELGKRVEVFYAPGDTE